MDQPAFAGPELISFMSTRIYAPEPEGRVLEVGVFYETGKGLIA
jgi:hypothetical protein